MLIRLPNLLSNHRPKMSILSGRQLPWRRGDWPDSYKTTQVMALRTRFGESNKKPGTNPGFFCTTFSKYIYEQRQTKHASKNATVT